MPLFHDFSLFPLWDHDSQLEELCFMARLSDTKRSKGNYVVYKENTLDKKIDVDSRELVSNAI